jgi:NAD(P)-dependent dehydrogenase (short-subunit alcohol dehydrogenase family)
MSRPWILVCPSSRGLGHVLTRHLLRNTTVPILATARLDPAGVKDRLLDDIKHDREAAARLHVVQLDVTDEPSIEAASREAARLFPRDTHHLHLGLAIPGILHPEKLPGQVSAAAALETYRVNALGPLLLMKWFEAFLPRRRTQFARDDGTLGGQGAVRLPGHAVWLNMSARVGSTSDNRSGGWYSYRSSKAAVNSLTKSFDLQLAVRSGDKAMAMAYHPGTVRTDLSRDFWESVPKEQLFEPGFAAEKMVEVVTSKVGLDGRGRCWDWKGHEILP